jgi:hypothetical protein
MSFFKKWFSKKKKEQKPEEMPKINLGGKGRESKFNELSPRDRRPGTVPGERSTLKNSRSTTWKPATDTLWRTTATGSVSVCRCS